jgi:hypothetical protein
MREGLWCWVKDPIEERRNGRVAAADLRRQYAKAIARANAVFGDRSIGSIEISDILALVEPMWKTAPETTDRTRRHVEAVIDFATGRGLRKGDNPAAQGLVMGQLPERKELANGETVHHPALDYREVPAFCAELRALDTPAARCLLFTCLTASRFRKRGGPDGKRSIRPS